MPTIPQDYLAVISILITLLSHKLRSDNLSAGVNSAIAGVSILLIVLVTAWMSSGLSFDIRADVLLICSMALSLLPAFKELWALLGYQYQAGSPLLPKSARIVRPTVADWNRYPGTK